MSTLASPVFRELLLQRVSAFCDLTTEQIEQLHQHYELMQRWNRTINLTRIANLGEAIDRHYAESLFLGSRLPPGSLKIADLGSGAGFPGFPVAVLRPECLITLVESHQRKAVFLKEAARRLTNVSIAAKRAEDVTERFDWVLCRAVARDKIAHSAARLAPNWALLGNKGVPVPWDPTRCVELCFT